MRFLFIVLLLFSSLQAQADAAGYANIFYGLSVPDSANTGVHTVYGFNGGSPVTNLISLGGYHIVSDTQDGPNNSPFSYSQTGLETRFHLVTGDKNVFVSLRAGVSKVNTSSGGSEVIFSPYHYGLSSGYSFKMWSLTTLGFEGSYLEIEKSSTNSGSSSVNFNAFHTINFVLTLGLAF